MSMKAYIIQVISQLVNTANGIYIGKKVEYLVDIDAPQTNRIVDVNHQLFKTAFEDQTEYSDEINEMAFLMYDVEVISSKDLITKYNQIVVFVDEVISILIGDTKSLVAEGTKLS